MVPEKLIFSKGGEEEEEVQQCVDEADEEPSSGSDEETDVDSENEEEERTVMVLPKKPKLNPPCEEIESEPDEDGSECSSPSASGFIIMPAVKHREKKKQKNPFSKIFPEEDEIALLKGLTVFWANGRNNKWTEFYQFIKDDLPHQYTKIQVSEKIRGLKKKFKTNLEKSRGGGEFLDFLNPHETLLFELSKKLWGDEDSITEETRKGSIACETRERAVNEDDEKRKILEKQKQVVEIDKEDFESSFPLLCASFDTFGCPKLVKDKCFLIGREKAQELEEKWMELRDEELRLELKRIDLIKRDLQGQVQRK